jgi:hypothetical protein
LAVQNQSSASAAYFLNQAKVEGQFADQLYSLVPADSNTPDTLPTIVEFKPNMSFFCIKNLQVKRLWKEDFDMVRPVSFYRQDLTQFQSLAPIHLNPATSPAGGWPTPVWAQCLHSSRKMSTQGCFPLTS